jgi:hypothetical protein
VTGGSKSTSKGLIRDERSTSGANFNGQAQSRSKQSLNVNKLRKRNNRSKLGASFEGSNGLEDDDEPDERMSIEEDSTMRGENQLGGPFNNEESDYE